MATMIYEITQDMALTRKTDRPLAYTAWKHLQYLGLKSAGKRVSFSKSPRGQVVDALQILDDETDVLFMGQATLRISQGNILNPDLQAEDKQLYRSMILPYIKMECSDLADNHAGSIKLNYHEGELTVIKIKSTLYK